jgi:hypothetical protein
VRTQNVTLYKVVVRPVTTYASEIWTLTKAKAEERALGLFERKILRSIFGAVQDKGQWRRRYNFELYKLYDKPDLVKYIKLNRLKWPGHVMRMDNNQITQRMFNTRREGKRGTGRPQLRWVDSVDHDIRILGEKNWRNLALNREEWRSFSRRLGLMQGCRANDDDSAPIFSTEIHTTLQSRRPALAFLL